MKNHILKILAVFAMATSPAVAGVFFTNEAAFVAAIQPSYYLENFNSFTGGSPLNGQIYYTAPGGQGFGWTASSGGLAGSSGLYSINTALSVNAGGGNATITITFTNNPVTAVGGFVANTDFFGNVSPGTVGITTSDGGSNSIVFATAAQGFIGYISTVPISSITLSANDFVAVRHFYTGIGAFASPPLLKITAVAANVVLSWPTNASGINFTLQSTTNLASAILWSNVSPASVVVNGQNTITNSISSAQKFYRLSQ